MADKLKANQTMTTGVAHSKIQAGEKLSLHGHSVTIITTADDYTIFHYENGADRVIETTALELYLALDVFPTDTRFSRPAELGVDQVVIEAVTDDCCYQVLKSNTKFDVAGRLQFTHEQLMDWHMSGPKNPPEMKLPDGTKLYVPKLPAAPADEAGEPKEEATALEVDPQTEIAQLREKLDKAEKAVELVALRGQEAITRLEGELRDANIQTTLMEAKAIRLAGEIEDWRERASLLNAPVQPKLYRVSSDTSEYDLEKMSRDGWDTCHMQFTDDGSYLSVVFVRNVPAFPSKTPQAAEATATTKPLPTVEEQLSPTPATTGANSGAPVSRALTNNKGNQWDTRRIPSLQSQQGATS